MVLMVTHSAAILDGASRLLLLVNGRTSMFGEYRGVLAALQRTAVKPALANAEVG
jgi:ABC-type protease/lipase transport system fused ATPase/permease subunit